MVLNYLEENGRDAALTVGDLGDYVANLCSEPYTTKWTCTKQQHNQQFTFWARQLIKPDMS